MWTPSELSAIALMQQHGASSTQAQWLMQNLRDSGMRLANQQVDELVVRWVPISERAVPADADTIIRTITTTTNGVSRVQTFWLDGLRGPQLGVPPVGSMA